MVSFWRSAVFEIISCIYTKTIRWIAAEYITWPRSKQTAMHFAVKCSSSIIICFNQISFEKLWPVNERLGTMRGSRWSKISDLNFVEWFRWTYSKKNYEVDHMYIRCFSQKAWKPPAISVHIFCLPNLPKSIRSLDFGRFRTIFTRFHAIIVVSCISRGLDLVLMDISSSQSTYPFKVIISLRSALGAFDILDLHRYFHLHCELAASLGFSVNLNVPLCRVYRFYMARTRHGMFYYMSC